VIHTLETARKMELIYDASELVDSEEKLVSLSYSISDISAVN